jgi:hypothetical protein
MSLADLLFNDVEIANQKGVRLVLLARNVSANKVKRYLLRNKRKIGLKMAGASVIAVPTLSAPSNGSPFTGPGNALTMLVAWLR